ncbi:MAG: type II secretion system minor pseudopilin GspK [Planctomycetes bacterium]|nr:type II secretion system minor pseudopilin GspK [Planctomycetota bacterium]
MTSKREKTQQNGFVLVVVLCMVIMLAIILFGFNTESRMNLRAVDDYKKSEQALNCARAGLNIAIAAIGSTPDIHTNKTLQSSLLEEKTFDVANGTCSITVIEESGKLNINLLKDKNGKLNRTRTDQLLRLIDLLNRQHPARSRISYGLVPSIIDWIDNDTQVTYLSFIKHQNSGAESSYYSRLAPPYKCENKPLRTIEELLLVKAVTPQVFESICDYVTVYGDGKININYAPKLVLESVSEKIYPALAQTIIDRRKFKPFGSITELRDVPGMTDSIYYAIKSVATVGTAGQYYYVTSRGNVDHLGRTIIAVLRKNVKDKKIEIVLYKEC